jgi:hypothetical protein
MGKQQRFASDYISSAHFLVEFSIPADPPDRRYSQNLVFDVICATAERALVLVREQYPNAVVHVVRRVGGRKKMLIDEEVLKITNEA